MLRNTYILSNRKVISTLFKTGTKKTIKPITLISMPFEKNKVLFSVSKKHIPKAVDRNKIKRQMHAIYFNNLELFLQEPKKAIALTYISKSPTNFVEIKKSMTTLFSII
jgi:ribonuclease P protein component